MSSIAGLLTKEDYKAMVLYDLPDLMRRYEVPLKHEVYLASLYGGPVDLSVLEEVASRHTPKKVTL